MRQIRLGQTGLMVPEVGFGGIPIQRLTHDEAVRVVQHCIDLGATFLDTAHGYSTSEERIGTALQGRRDGLVIATKSPARQAEPFRQQMELSFQRLQVDYIDLFQFHNVSDEASYEQIMAPGGPYEIACRARDEGRIGHLGITSHTLDLAIEFARSDRFETIMFPFNYITDEAAHELIPLCRQHDIGFLAMKPMGGGLLSDATLSFKYLQQWPDILMLVGIERCKEIDEIVDVVEGSAALSDAERARIAAIREELGHQFCRRCGYCQPCPQEIDITVVMTLKSWAQRMPTDRLFGEWGQALIARAETCIDCGECEERCPYHLPIREIMREMIPWYHEQLALEQAQS
jgi:predicted aldo/keto reductase-like oxidoreductase